MAGVTYTYSKCEKKCESIKVKLPLSRLEFSVGFSRTFYVYIIKYIWRNFYNNEITF